MSATAIVIMVVIAGLVGLVVGFIVGGVCVCAHEADRRIQEMKE